MASFSGSTFIVILDHIKCIEHALNEEVLTIMPALPFCVTPWTFWLAAITPLPYMASFSGSTLLYWLVVVVATLHGGAIAMWGCKSPIYGFFLWFNFVILACGCSDHIT